MGPAALGLVADAQAILTISQLGVVMFLLVNGRELPLLLPLRMIRVSGRGNKGGFGK